MNKALYINKLSWVRFYLPFQFNADIQNTQNIELFNVIIKKFLNSANSFYDVKEAIDKRFEEESYYCKLINIKAKHITIGLLIFLYNSFLMLI